MFNGIFLSKWRLMRRHFFFVGMLGFISGLPLSLLGSTLAAWLSSEGISLINIGFLSLIHQPYVFKFLWAPLLDIALFKFIDRRRGWILICQIILCIGIIVFSLSDPLLYAKPIGLLAFVLVFMSATQDIAIDAYRTELLKPHERGLGTTFFILSYRIALLVSGALALVIADYWGWPTTFILLASLFIPSCLFIYFFNPTQDIQTNIEPNAVNFNLWDSIKIFVMTSKGIKIIIFIILFKLGDVFTSANSVLLMPFLLNESKKNCVRLLSLKGTKKNDKPF